MIMSVKSELIKLKLLVEYANDLVEKSGVAEQKRLGLLDLNVDSRYFKYLLYVSNVYPDFDGNKGVRFSVRNALYKRIGRKLEYITLLDPTNDDYAYPDFDWYESKCNLDCCEAISSLKRLVRAMIKDPDNYWRVD
jgi:hypothetical protein